MTKKRLNSVRRPWHRNVWAPPRVVASKIMSLDGMLQFVPVFVLVLFRIAGMMLYAPLLGSAKIPKRVKALFAIILALGMTGSVARPVAISDDQPGEWRWVSAARSFSVWRWAWS